MENNEKIKLVLDYLENVNFAIVQSRTKVCRWCVVENRQTTDIARFRLTVEGDYIEPFTTPDYFVGAESVVRVSDINLQVKVSELARLTESVPSALTVRMEADGVEIYTQSFPISFMPYDQWNGTQEYPQLISSFVTPNHPCIATLIRKASDHLFNRTGYRAFNNYLSGNVDEVIAQIRAIYEAVYEEKIGYIFCPPSYEDKGQRIRLADKVMHDKMGNCIELTLLFAACFEYIELNSIIFLTPLHAIIGVWLTPDCCAKSVDDDVAFLMDNTREGQERILFFECTAVTSPDGADFNNAIFRTSSIWNDLPDDFCYVDLYRCRREGFRPLPQLVNDDGSWRLSEARPRMDEVEEGFGSIDQTQTEEQESTWHNVSKLQMWERKLLDFTLRNTLLNIKMSSALQLIAVDAGQLCEEMAHSGRRFTLTDRPQDVDGLDSLDSEAVFDSLRLPGDVYGVVRDDMRRGLLHSYHKGGYLVEILKKLRRNTQLMMEENGANSLFLAVGLLRWMEEGNLTEPRIAPILLLPVELTYRNSAFHIQWNGEEIMLNVTLIEYLRQNFEMDFPNLDEAMNEEGGVNVQKVLSIIRQSVKHRPDWGVAEEAVLGIFSFSKFVMWNDIHSNGKDIYSHPIVKALVDGDAVCEETCTSAASSDGAPTPSDVCSLDAVTHPSDLCLPLPYDSSQLTAVMEAMRGKSFILHGPPGTGKSQTITNMIASALFAGKRVLFVAEKRAALSVVQERLERLGLDAFCLELHSNKSTKQHLLHQLESVLTVGDGTKGLTDYHTSGDRLKAQRLELMKYIDALHSRTSDDDFSLYECITQYGRFKNGCSTVLEPSEGEQPAITPDNLEEYVYFIDRLSSIIRLIGHPSQHALRGLKPNAGTTLHLPEFAAALQRCAALSAPLPALAEKAGEWLGRAKPETLDELAHCMHTLQHYHQLRQAILQGTNPSILQADAYRLQSQWDTISSHWAPLRFFQQQLFCRQLRRSYRPRLKRHETGTLVSQLYTFTTDDTLQRIHRSVADSPMLLEEMLTAYDAWQQSFEALTQADIEQPQTLQIDQLESLLNRWRNGLDQMKDWKQWCLMKDDLQKKHMGEFAHRLEQSPVALSELRNAYFMRHFKEKAMAIIASSDTLDMFNGLLFDEQVDRYRQLARDFQNLSKAVLYRSLAARATDASVAESLANQMVVLQRNISSRGRGTSIRRLFEQIPDIISEFCPCMLMSPMSVAQYVDIHRQFDLVIFDEASQIPTSEAVGAIARGKNVVIVGDTKQMPPTSFFTSTRLADIDFDKDDLESILEDCHALKLPSLLLSWHYRSRHESLIAFSNTEFYDSRLYTFPAVDDQQRRATFVPVKGLYHKGGSRSNRHEALAVVNEIERRLTDEHLRKLSIGVISFNVQQQYLIEDLLDERMEKNRQLKAWAEESGESIFVKNLENVQGDERDVILFSIGYGPDKDGKISMNFGPLNLVGGERRLNVAVTRSRYEMMVFSSLHASDIDLRRSNAQGVLELKRFLDYVETGTLVQPAQLSTDARTDKVVTEQIAAALRDRGLKVNTYVGKSRFKVNLAIAQPDSPSRYLLGVILDDKAYVDTPTMSDREIIQPQILQSLGWHLIHAWTMDWFERPQHVISTILAEVESLRGTDETTLSTTENIKIS